MIWRTLLGRHPVTEALKTGLVSSPIVQLDFADVLVPNRAFKAVVRNLEYDVAELALMTFLQAQASGTPLTLLPIVLFSRNPLPYLVCRATRRRLEPRDLHGCRVGVRAYTTTTAAWLRGILSDEYAVDSDRIEWLTIEEAHVAGYVDPPNVRRLPPESNLKQLLIDGDIDAAIVDPPPTDDGFAAVVPDAAAVFERWRRRHGAVPINHIVTVKSSLAAEQPVAVNTVVDLFERSRQLATGVDFDSVPFGLDAIRPSLNLARVYAYAQHLI